MSHACLPARPCRYRARRMVRRHADGDVGVRRARPHRYRHGTVAPGRCRWRIRTRTVQLGRYDLISLHGLRLRWRRSDRRPGPPPPRPSLSGQGSAGGPPGHHRCCPAELRLRAACAVCSLQAGKAQEDRTEQDSSVRTEYTHHRTTCSLSLSLLRQEGGPREKRGLARRPS